MLQYIAALACSRFCVAANPLGFLTHIAKLKQHLLLNHFLRHPSPPNVIPLFQGYNSHISSVVLTLSRPVNL